MESHQSSLSDLTPQVAPSETPNKSLLHSRIFALKLLVSRSSIRRRDQTLRDSAHSSPPANSISRNNQIKSHQILVFNPREFLPGIMIAAQPRRRARHQPDAPAIQIPTPSTSFLRNHSDERRDPRMISENRAGFKAVNHRNPEPGDGREDGPQETFLKPFSIDVTFPSLRLRSRHCLS